jgi:ribosomal protein L11 methyltransferase
MLRLAVRVRREQADLVLAELLELAPGGVEETELDGLVEYALYGAPGELPALPELTAAVGGALVEVSTRELADDWSERWREFHQPLVLGGRLTVRPPWEPPRGTPIELVIDPGRAFGTGAHATTRLCLELMLDLRPSDGFLDLGCGSAVLAIAAAKFGWAPVIALDNDPAAVDAARTNAAANRVALDVRRVDLRVEPVPEAPTIAANLLAPLLLAWVPRVPSAVRRVIASGVLVQEADRVGAAFADVGLMEVARRSRGEWAALLLERVGTGLGVGRVLARRPGG